MPIQWRTDYAIRLMYEAARLGYGKRATVQYLAKAAEVPYDFARQIANDLVHAGLLESQRGPRGGMKLAREADEITILDVFQATGDLPSLSLCTHTSHICSRQETCPVKHGVWAELDEAIYQHLSRWTLADAIAKGDELQAAAS